jgi:hypothetical protein
MLTRGLLWRLASLPLIRLYGVFTVPVQCLSTYLVLKLKCWYRAVYLWDPLYGALKARSQFYVYYEFRADQKLIYDRAICFGPPCCQRVLIVHCSVIRDERL